MLKPLARKPPGSSVELSSPVPESWW